MLPPSHHSRDISGDDRHHKVPRQLLHEPLSQTRLYRLQRPHPGAQVIAQCNPARSIARDEPGRAEDRADCCLPIDRTTLWKVAAALDETEVASVGDYCDISASI